MKKLNLKFLDNPHLVDQPNLISILEEFGKEIEEYGQDYFKHVVTTTSNEGVLLDFTLYIIVPAIGYDYKVLNIEVNGVKKLKISFFTLITKQTQHFQVDITKGTELYEKKLSELLSSPLFNESLKFLVDQVEMKKNFHEE